MADDLRPATHKETAWAISYALRFDGKKRFRQGTEYMADITAKHLIEKLKRAGFVIMKKPPIGGHGGGFGAPLANSAETRGPGPAAGRNGEPT